MSEVAAATVLLHEEAGLRSPSGLVYDEGTQTVTIVDMGNRRLLCFDLKKRGLSSVCPAVPGWRPLAAAMAAGGLAVTDVESNDIWIRRKERWRKAIASEGLAPPLHLPGSIAGDRLGNWYFTDFHNNRICMQKDGRSSVLEEIDCVKPYGLCLWKERLYVTDTGRGRILCCDLRHHRCRVEVKGEARFFPIAVAADSSGDLYISTARRIFLYRPSYRRLELILDAAAWERLRPEKLGHIGALACLPESGLLFTDTVRNALYHLRVDKFI